MTYKLDHIKVLIVEDMFPMLTLTKSLLHIMGFRQLLTARDGKEAYDIYKEEVPDIILTDWHMDGIDGLEFIHRVRNDKDSPNPYTPIVLMTGYSSRHRVESARDNGMTEFLMKPYTANDLYLKVVQLIEKPRPFIKCDNFFGPDRRRKRDQYNGPIRRAEDYYKQQNEELQELADEIIMKDKE